MHRFRPQNLAFTKYFFRLAKYYFNKLANNTFLFQFYYFVSPRSKKKHKRTQYLSQEHRKVLCKDTRRTTQNTTLHKKKHTRTPHTTYTYKKEQYIFQYEPHRILLYTRRSQTNPTRTQQNTQKRHKVLFISVHHSRFQISDPDTIPIGLRPIHNTFLAFHNYFHQYFIINSYLNQDRTHNRPHTYTKKTHKYYPQIAK